MDRHEVQPGQPGDVKRLLRDLSLPISIRSSLLEWTAAEHLQDLLRLLNDIQHAASLQTSLINERRKVYGRTRDRFGARDEPGLLTELKTLTAELVRMIVRAEHCISQIDILEYRDGRIIVPSVDDPVLFAPTVNLYRALPLLKKARVRLTRPAPDLSSRPKRGRAKTSLEIAALGGRVARRQLVRILRDRLVEARRPPLTAAQAQRRGARALAHALVCAIYPTLQPNRHVI